MLRVRPALRALPLLLVALLAACGPRGAATNNTLALAMSGSLDRGADSREKLPDGLRKVTTWTTRVPVPAREVRVTYDIDQRTVGWRVDVEGSRGALADLAAGTLEKRGEVAGTPVYVVHGGPLDGAVARGTDRDFTIVSPNYARRYEPALAPYVP